MSTSLFDYRDNRFSGTFRSVDLSTSSTDKINFTIPNFSQTSFTIMIWYYMVSQQSSFTPVVISVSDGTNFSSLQIATNSQIPAINNPFASSSSSLTFTLKKWYNLALVGSPTANTMYIRTRSTNYTVTSIHSAISGTNNVTTIGPATGYVSACKTWTYPLTASDLLRESMQRAPLSNTTKLVSYLPLADSGSALTDDVCSRALTKSGTVKTALVGPPIPEVLNPKRFFFLTPATTTKTPQLMTMGVGS